MQETHSDDESTKFWEQEWRGVGFWSHGETDSKGVGILI